MGTEPRERGKGNGSALASGAGRGPAPLDLSGSLATRQVDQMVAAWRRGERPLAEEILADHPELGAEAAIRLIYEEVCLRLEAGQTVDPAEIVRRFPQWRSELEILLDCELKMHAGPGQLRFPEIGETVAGFRLIWELGRGAAGRVFLASQPSLADRPVVLKITSRGREEHLSLARLQHMNIVPLYSEHVLQARNLQILCMPFLGGATLAQVLEILKDQAPQARTGKQLIEALDEIESRLPIASPAQGPFRNFLGRCSYVSAICSIGACLADGLQYAHDRKLVHMDIKPSNVLLADDGQPMLLDFHLARGPIRPQEPAPTWLGGTPGSMAPEQERAVNCLRDGRPITERVDERADLYALGFLLYEALGGPHRDSPGAWLPELCRINGGVSPGLSDVIHKCLCPDPRHRYADAASLATDLRCHLADLPLRGVPNRSLMERWRKWRRRKPFGLLRSLLMLVSIAAVIATATLAGAGYRHRVMEIQSSLDQGRALLRRGQHSEAAVVLRRGLALTGGLPFIAEPKEALAHSLAAATRREKAAEIHRLAELIRFRYAIAQPPPDEAQWLITRGREIWQARGLLRRPPDAPSRSGFEETITRDMLDFVSIWTGLLIRQAASGELPEAREEADRVIKEAEAQFGPIPSFHHAPRGAGVSPGQAGGDEPAAINPTTAWEFSDLGRSYLRAGKFELASEQFQRGLETRPQDFWLNFYQGLVAYRTGQFSEAVHAFHICIVLSPETAECYYNRGLAFQELGDVSKAVRDYGQALKLNSKLTDAALNRGILFYRMGRLDDATSDLELALHSTENPAAQGDILHIQALVELARGNRPKALDHLRTPSDCGHAKARELRQRLLRER